MRDRSRVLVVQRTGWGKSAVYFLTTHLLRQQGLGPTLLISPLLALMRNQIDAADPARAALRDRQQRLATPRSPSSSAALRADDGRPAADLARAARQPRVRRQDHADRRQPTRADRHRRGALHLRLGPRLPPRLPPHRTHRRPARRLRGPDPRMHRHRQRPRRRRRRRPARRRAHHVPRPAPPRRARARAPSASTGRPNDWRGSPRRCPSSTAPASSTASPSATSRHVADWLAGRGHRRRGVLRRRSTTQLRLDAERSCRPTRSRCSSPPPRSAWATTSPTSASSSTSNRPARPSPTTSRSAAPGAPSTRSSGVLLRGLEDEQIQDYFIERAFAAEHARQRHRARCSTPSTARSRCSRRPEQGQRQDRRARAGREAARRRRRPRAASAARPTSAPSNRGRTPRAGSSRSPTPAAPSSSRWSTTSAPPTCRMRFIANLLDDPSADDCGICDNCTGSPDDRDLPVELVAEAETFLRERPITARDQEDVLRPRQPGAGEKIPDDERLEDGRVLSIWGDAGWGQLVRDGKLHAGTFDDRLVDALAELVEQWAPEPAPAVGHVGPVAAPPRSSCAGSPSGSPTRLGPARTTRSSRRPVEAAAAAAPTERRPPATQRRGRLRRHRRSSRRPRPARRRPRRLVLDPDRDRPGPRTGRSAPDLPCGLGLLGRTRLMQYSPDSIPGSAPAHQPAGALDAKPMTAREFWQLVERVDPGELLHHDAADDRRARRHRPTTTQIGCARCSTPRRRSASRRNDSATAASR